MLIMIMDYKNLKFKYMNKRAISVAIMILALSAVILFGLSLLYFNFLDNKYKETLDIHGNLDEIYYKKELLRFYLSQAFDNSVKNFNLGLEKTVFIDNFRKELSNFKNDEGYLINELNEIELGLNEENLEINENKLVLTINLKLINEWSDIKTIYIYEEKFEKIFKQ